MNFSEGMTMSSIRMDEGSGHFVFADQAAGSRRSMRIFYFRPKMSVRNPRFVIALHGLDRAASAFRDVLAKQAEQHDMIVLVPEFDSDAFPGVYAYNYGNVRHPPPSNAVLAREHWTFGIIDRLFQYVRCGLNSDRTTFGMFGNSAGSQFVLRYLALNPAAAVDQAVASNSGMYMLPDLRLNYPSGMGGLDLDEGFLKRYFGRRLTILLGEADIDSTASDLPRNDEAMAQGPHRLARGLWHFDLCKQICRELEQPLAWKLETAPAAGHIDQRIFDRAVTILASNDHSL
jgi:pimeloyl-ACP methyl ester carboxylesterase